MTMNMWDIVGCLKLDILHRHPQSFLAINFGFVTTSLLDRQAYTFLSIFQGFSCRLMVHNDRFLCNAFPHVIDLGFSFHGSYFFVGFVGWSNKFVLDFSNA